MIWLRSLIDYLKVRDTLISKKSNNTLFLSRYGTKMSSTAIEKIVKRAYKRAKIKNDDFAFIHYDILVLHYFIGMV